jgi:DNA-binding HxlR family transcriptional regulator
MGLSSERLILKSRHSLTEFGKTVLPVLDALCEWGNGYLGRECILDKNEGGKTADRISQ